MMSTVSGNRRGVAASDALVVLSLLSLAFAVVYPMIAAAVRQQEVDAAVADVETLRGSALAYFQENGTWPADAPAGTVPAELAPSLPPDFALEWGTYTVDWALWETVREAVPDSAEDVLGSVSPTAGTPPPEVIAEPTPQEPTTAFLAGISLYTDDELLLAALLRRYGPELSFVHGSVWTLVLTEGG